MSKPERPKRRMLLVASIGVATVSYALAACEKSPSGNLMPPQTPTAEMPPTSGNLMAPPEPGDASTPIATPPPENPPPTSGNLVAPPPGPKVDTTPPKPPPHSGNLMPPPPRK